MTARIGAVAAVLVTIVAGLWFWSGVVAPGYWTAIAAGVLWFVIVGAITSRVARRAPSLRRAVRGTFVVAAVAATAGFFWTSVRETEVNERLETGVPASELAPADQAPVDDLLAPQP